MAMIDTEVITLGVILITPIYVYLHKISLTLTKFSDRVQNCKYCNMDKKPVEEEVEEL